MSLLRFAMLCHVFAIFCYVLAIIPSGGLTNRPDLDVLAVGILLRHDEGQILNLCKSASSGKVFIIGCQDLGGLLGQKKGCEQTVIS